MKRILAMALVMLVSLTTLGCGEPARGRSATRTSAPSDSAALVGRLSEVAAPDAIQSLRQLLESYQPQVKILNPRPNEVIQDERVSVRFQVKDLPLFKDEELGLGPHLHVFLDNQPYTAVYTTDEPLVFENLTPGTHTIRAFASRPWHESFKNEGAFAQTTFHVYTKTPDNLPDPTQPGLTYSRPQGSYGAEPILLDFYLTNAPLHLIALEQSDDTIRDWKIRCTVNGQSFTFNAWEPIYLKGFKPGKNWVQLELLDEDNNLFPNAFNNTVRLITYEPGGTDTLAKLVRGELADARSIVDPDYQPEPPTPEEPIPVPEPEEIQLPNPELEVSPTPLPETTPQPLSSPPVEETSETEIQLEDETSSFEVQPKETDVEIEKLPSSLEPLGAPSSELEPEASESPEAPSAPAIAPSPQPKSSKIKEFFNRFRRPSTSPPIATPTPVLAPTPLPSELDEAAEAVTSDFTAEPPTEEPVLEAPKPVPPLLSTPDPILPIGELNTPAAEATVEDTLGKDTLGENTLGENALDEDTLGEQTSGASEPTPDSPAPPEAITPPNPSPVKAFFNRFRRPAAATRSVPPTPPTEAPPPEIPEVIDIPAPVTDVPAAITPDAESPVAEPNPL